MATGLTGIADVQTTLQKEFQNEVLYTFEKPRVYSGLIDDTRPIKKGMGNNGVSWERYADLPLASTLTEGTPPAAQKLSSTELTSTPVEKGLIVQISNRAKDQAYHDPQATATFLLRRSFQDTKEADYATAMGAGTNVRYANGVANRASVATAIADADIESAVNTLETNNARKRTMMTMGSQNIGTQPLQPQYICIVDQDIRFDVTDLTGFVGSETYSQQRPLFHENEFGSIPDKNIAFVRTSEGIVFEDAAGGGTKDVYGCIVVGMDAFASVGYMGNEFIFNTKGFGEAGDDVLKQYMLAGYRYDEATAIKHQAAVVRIEVLKSADV